MDEKLAVMGPEPEVKVVVSLDVATQVVAPVAAVPWLFVKHRWTVQTFPAESETEERSPSLPSTVAVLSPANHKTAIFPASRFSVATVQASVVPAVLLWAVHVAPPTPKAACASFAPIKPTASVPSNKKDRKRMPFKAGGFVISE